MLLRSNYRTMPNVAQRFEIPEKFTARDIKAYGFYGLSYQFIASLLLELNQRNLPKQAIVAHLRSGASMSVLLDGQSISTDMTCRLLDGLPMATRCGAIDASVVPYMALHLITSHSLPDD